MGKKEIVLEKSPLQLKFPKPILRLKKLLHRLNTAKNLFYSFSSLLIKLKKSYI